MSRVLYTPKLINTSTNIQHLIKKTTRPRMYPPHLRDHHHQHHHHIQHNKPQSYNATQPIHNPVICTHLSTTLRSLFTTRIYPRCRHKRINCTQLNQHQRHIHPPVERVRVTVAENANGQPDANEGDERECCLGRVSGV